MAMFSLSLSQTQQVQSQETGDAETQHPLGSGWMKGFVLKAGKGLDSIWKQ